MEDPSIRRYPETAVRDWHFSKLMQPSESAAVELENEIPLPCPEAEEQDGKPLLK